MGVLQMFGTAAESEPILYCHKKTENTKPAYVGTNEAIMKFLEESPDAKEAMNIAEIGQDNVGQNPHAFIAGVVDGKGNVSKKAFTMAPMIKYVLYTKQGWETMACVKPLEQFKDEAQFY